MKERFLHTYPPEDIDLIEDLADDVYEQYPYAIAYTLDQYEKYLDDGNYFRAFRRYIDFFELAVQYNTGLILSILKHSNIPFDDTLQQVATKIVSKPLAIGDWINDIFIVLLKRAYEVAPNDELIKTLHEVIFEPKGNFLQGWSSRQDEEFKGISFFRNEYLGHDSSLDDSIYREILEKIEPRIFKMAEAMAPLATYTTFTVDKVVDEESEEKNYTIIPMKGADFARPLRISSDAALKENTYYLIRRELKRRDQILENELIEISPFVVYLPVVPEKEDEKTPYLFQSVHQRNLKRMIYISPNQMAKRRETELFKDPFVAFLQKILSKSMIGDNYKIEIATGKTWEEYAERINAQTTRFLGQMKVEKYDPYLYVERKEVMDSWYAFMDSAHKRAIVLLGNAGSGKTNLICKLSEIYSEKQIPVITFNSKIFSQVTLEEKLLDLFEDSKTPVTETLSRINKFADDQNKHAIFIFDALNECLFYARDRSSNGAVKLLQDIDRLMVKQELNRFRIMITCRTYTWEEAIRNEKESLNLALYFTPGNIVGKEETANVSLKGFSANELQEAYPRYRRKYELQTSLDTLLEPGYSSLRARLEDPIVLKISSQIYSGSHLPKTARELDSVSLFNARLNMLEQTPNGGLQVYILELYTQTLRRMKMDALRMNLLYAAYEDDTHELHELAKSLFMDETFNFTMPVNALIDAGMLRVEKSTFHQELRFVYERFHEYMYARVFVEEETSLLDPGLPIPAGSYEKELKEMKGYAVVNGALRHALTIDYHRTGGDPSVFIQLSLSAVYGAPALVMDALVTLTNENYEEVCRIIRQLVSYKRDELLPLIETLEKKELLLEEGKKGKQTLSTQELEGLNKDCDSIMEQLTPVIRIRKVAVNSIYDIFRSPVYARDLYMGDNSPFKLLWEAMSDPMARVRDNVSLYIYYISRYDRSIAVKILQHLSGNILDTSLWSLTSSSKRQELKQSFIEPSGRLSLLMIVEGLVERGDYELSRNIINTWDAILRKFTLNHTLIKVVLPFLKFFLRRQATVQVEYVNNGIEYQHFWDAIPATAGAGQWSMQAFEALIPFLDHSKPGLEQQHEEIFRGIESGDAFSFFLIERVIVTQGWEKWENIAPILRRVMELPDDQPLLDYIQMSMLYVLFHVIEKSDEMKEEAFLIFSELCENWSERCRGLLMAHNNHKANKGKPYKQYPLNWYGAAYCKHFGDGGKRPGDEYPLPVFRHLIKKGFEQRDKELLYYCIENMAVLVTDFSRPESALQLFEYLMGLFEYESAIADFDRQETTRPEYDYKLRDFLCKMIGTIKSYYPRETDHFIYNKLVNSSFPDIDRFREELINYNQSHESIGDLLTHKFGNFIIWGLLHDKDIMQFFKDGFSVAPKQKDYFSWFDGIVRLSFRNLFKMKV